MQEKEGMSSFDPRILAFTCNWCSYAGADLAGTSRIDYSTNVRLIRVMCSGRVDPIHVLEAFRNGADGVLVTGCHPGDCHYMNGNTVAEMRVKFLKMYLEQLGIEPERLRLEWISATEGERFARIVDEMVEKMRELGPSSLKNRGAKTSPSSERLMKMLEAAIGVVGDERVRWLIGRSKDILSSGKIDEPRLESLMRDVLKTETERWLLIRELQGRSPLTIEELTEATDVAMRDVVSHVMALQGLRRVRAVGEKDHQYLYTLSEEMLGR